MTACRIPASPGLCIEVVEEAGARGHPVGEPAHVAHGAGGIGVQIGHLEFAGGEFGEEVDADRFHQWLGERVVDHRVVGPAGKRPGGGHHRRGGSHARRQIPGVVVGSSHDEYLPLVSTGAGAGCLPSLLISLYNDLPSRLRPRN
jgi:hypothetical protein